jgi:hypothetical protein
MALKIARAADIDVRLDGDDLVLKASTAPPAEIIDLLSATRPTLCRCSDGWSADDWQVFFDERAGIAEFNGGLPCREAEARAFACCVVEWLDRNPRCSPPGPCLGCGAAEHAGDPLLPFGTESIGHAWLHRAAGPIGTIHGRWKRSPR